tara:strand:- start:942 stop:1685 length:744 start_codon:yes stop_codon:yes gene_type:complete
MAKLLGPCDVVPCENPVVVQCVVKKGDKTFIQHPAFTDGEKQECSGVVAMVVFCSATRLTESSVFVGVIASDPTAHGSTHGHVSVFVRGCVTMACDLQCLTDVRDTMATICFTTDDDNTSRFVGIDSQHVPPFVERAGKRSCSRVIGTLVEKGRPPSNEVRVILEPNRHYRLSGQEWAQDVGDDLEAVVGDFTINELRGLKGLSDGVMDVLDDLVAKVKEHALSKASNDDEDDDEALAVEYLAKNIR